MCSGPDVGTAQGKQGCGFNGGGGGNATAGGEGAGGDASGDAGETPAETGGGEVDAAGPGSENVGTGNGKQFITGQCLSDADCASGCCAGSEGSSTAACSAVLASTESGKTGCGFGS